MDAIIILAIGMAMALIAATLLDRRAAKSTHSRTLKATLSSCVPPPPVVHFGAPTALRCQPLPITPGGHPDNETASDSAIKAWNKSTGGDAA